VIHGGSAAAQILPASYLYDKIGPLNLSSDAELRNWASISGFSGVGTYESPIFITELNITSLSGTSLKLSNITDTWFTFFDCIFIAQTLYRALEIYNVSHALFESCNVNGVAFLNSSRNSLMFDTYFAEALLVNNCTDITFYTSFFDIGTVVTVGSAFYDSYSLNVSFVENTFNASLRLFECHSSYILFNSFFSSVYDEGLDNYWDRNFYFDYDGVGPYLIPGIAGSVDQYPQGRSTTSIDTTTTTEAIIISTPIVDTSTPPPPSTPSQYNGTPLVPFHLEPMFYVIIIVIELGIIFIILTSRRQPIQ
jgi:hypothetical protein